MNRQYGDVNPYQAMYDRMAPFYGKAMRLLPMWRSYVEEVLPWLDPLPADASVLEIGPGPGVLLSQLGERFAVAVGLDLSLAMLRQADRRLRSKGLPRRLTQGNAVSLPFVGAAFDAVTLTFAFSAIPEGLAALREIARVLKPGGLVVLVDAGVPSDGNPIGVGLAHLWERFDDHMRDEAALMRAAGLTVVKRREFGAFNGIRLVVGVRL